MRNVGLTEMFSSIFDDDAFSPESARERLRWAAAGDLMAAQMLVLVGMSDPEYSGAWADALDELAESNLIGEGARNLVRAGEVGQGTIQVVRDVFDNDLPAVEAGLRGLPPLAGGAGSGKVLVAATVEHVLSTSASYGLKLLAGPFKQAVGRGITDGLAYLTNPSLPNPSGRLAARAARSLHNGLMKLLGLLGGQGIGPRIDRWLQGSTDLLQDWARNRLNGVFDRAQLEVRCERLLASVNPGRTDELAGALEKVESSFKRWNQWNGIIATAVRLASVFFAVPPIGAVVVAVGLAQIGVLTYTTWDHLDSPESWRLHSFAPSVIDALVSAQRP